jgi:hypothetical protein
LTHGDVFSSRGTVANWLLGLLQSRTSHAIGYLQGVLNGLGLDQHIR